jgi:undecaprenyl diphosphate synthase
MDGNGRWAEGRGLDRLSGHAAGAEAVLKAIEASSELGIEYLSLYAFSLDNFKRPKREIFGIFGIIADFLEEKLIPLVKAKNYRLRFIGDLQSLPPDLLGSVSKANVAGLNNSGMTIIIALGYSGRAEIAAAFNYILERRVLDSDMSPVTYEEIERSLSTAMLPDPDAVVRYGGYQRLSDFLPLQTVYSELFFLDKLWPDFEKRDLYEISGKFERIRRNYGNIN